MVQKKKTLPYSTVDEKRDQPFTIDLELASLFILADIRRKGAPLSAMVRLYYPIHVLRGKRGAILIDMLGLNHTTIKYNIIPDTVELQRVLEANSHEPDAFRRALRTKGIKFNNFVSSKTVRIRGLMRGKSEEFQELLENMCDLKRLEEQVVFKPLLKRRDIRSITKAIQNLRENLEKDLKKLEAVKRGINRSLNTIKKVLKEEIQKINDKNSKKKALMEEKFEKIKEKRRKTLNLDLKKKRKRYHKRVEPVRDERANLKRRLARRRKKLNLLKAEKNASTIANALSKEIGELKIKFNEVDREFRSLQAWCDSEIAKARAQYKKDLEPEMEKINKEKERSLEEVEKKKVEISKIDLEAKKVKDKIEKMIILKKRKLRFWSKPKLGARVQTHTLYIPFYIFQYGDKRFNYYPPVVVSSAKGLLSRFKRMLADNLESKMNQLMRPRVSFLEKYLARAVKELNRNKSISTVYRRVGDKLNLLRDHEAIVKIMTGLMKIRQEGWINDSEYIRLQEALVQNIDMI